MSAGAGEVNIPEVLQEVEAFFDRYENGIAENDIEVIDDTFWNSPLTVRYAFSEVGYGFDEIHASRVNPEGNTARSKGSGTSGKEKILKQVRQSWVQSKTSRHR